MPLSSAQKRKLKALAQKLEPSLKVGRNGVSEAFQKSFDEELSRHELVKIKFVEFKEQRRELAALLAEKSSSELVMQVGHVAVFFRQQADPAVRQMRI